MPLVVCTLSTTFLALVFFASGALKLRTIDATRSALSDLDVPRFLQNRQTATAAPYAELALALALVCAPAPLFTVVSATAVAVMALFLLVTARSTRRPEPVFCNCFGSLSAQPVGRAAVVRDAVLLVMALISLTFAREGVVWAIGLFDSASLVAYLATLAIALAVTVMLLLLSANRRSELSSYNGSPQRAATVDGSPWPIPDVEVTTEHGDVIPLARVASDRATLLLLLSAECTPCRHVLSSIPGWQQQLRGAVDIAILTSENPDVIGPLVERLAAPVFYGYRALRTVTGISGVPAAFLLTPDHNVSAGAALGFDEIDSMVGAIIAVVESPSFARQR